MLASSDSPNKQSASLQVAIGLRPARPFEKPEDPAYPDYAKGLKVFKIDEKLERAEAAGILQGLYEARLIRGTRRETILFTEEESPS
jgi:hypothetical protein